MYFPRVPVELSSPLLHFTGSRSTFNLSVLSARSVLPSELEAEVASFEFAPAMTVHKFQTMQDRRVPVTIKCERELDVCFHDDQTVRSLLGYPTGLRSPAISENTT